MYVIYLDACHGFSFFCNNFNILCIFCVFVFWRATFPSLTRGNSIVCMFFGFVCVFCVCVRVLCVYVLVCTSLASYISIALREVIRLPPASIDPSLPLPFSPNQPLLIFNLNKPCVICVLHFLSLSLSNRIELFIITIFQSMTYWFS